jgi:ribosome-associated translation inhibitor RaiA
MEMPLQLSFHNLEPSDALAELIREHTAKLEEHYPRLIGCKVVVEDSNHHHRRGKGRHFRVLVELFVPGETLVADRDTETPTGGSDAYLAVAHAFEAARRQLEDFAGRSGWEKPHQRRARKSRPWIAGD